MLTSVVRLRIFAIRNLVALIACAFSLTAQAHIEIGAVPPDYLGKSEHGEKMLVSEQHGKLVIVSFFASWCGPCRKELPILAALQKRIGRDKITVVAVNYMEDYDVVRSMRRQLRDYQMTITSDSSGRIGRQYDVSGLPRMVIIGKDGKVAAQHIGYGEDMVPQLIDEINRIWNGHPLESATQDN